MKAEDLPEIFILFYEDEVPKKFTYVDVGSWDVQVMDQYKDWQFWDNVGNDTAWEHWERSRHKFRIVWPEEYDE